MTDFMKDFSSLGKDEQYKDYLQQHIENVKKGYAWLRRNLPELFTNVNVKELDAQIERHDTSKTSEAEWAPYREYFYGEKTSEVKEDFDYAWLHHIHCNAHHWQYWLLVEDDAKKDLSTGTTQVKALEMPYEYIIEMVCDWWAFSWKKNIPTEIFKWYADHEQKIFLNPKSQETLNNILTLMKEKISIHW